MSRIGKQPVKIPAGVTVTIEGQTVRVEGPVGKLTFTARPEISLQLSEDKSSVIVKRKDDDRLSRCFHGLTRSLVANMVEGCRNGFTKSLEVYGVGYSVQLQGEKLSLNVGKSHPIVFDIPAGLKVEVAVAQARGESEPARFSVKGADKQAVGEFAAQVRRTRPPEPYKGKGVRYAGEYVRRKVGKALAGAAG